MSAALAIAPADASAARAGQRVIAVHLTPFAPGCERLGIDDKRRWATFWNKPTALVLRAVLTRLNRAPGEITTATLINGDVDLLAPPAADLEGLLSSPDDQPVPHATIWDGAAETEVLTILAQLRDAGWAPAAKAA